MGQLLAGFMRIVFLFQNPLNFSRRTAPFDCPAVWRSAALLLGGQLVWRTALPQLLPTCVNSRSAFPLQLILRPVCTAPGYCYWSASALPSAVRASIFFCRSSALRGPHRAGGPGHILQGFDAVLEGDLHEAAVFLRFQHQLHGRLTSLRQQA